jgi:hypothetical protein
MQRTLNMKNRWETLIPIPADQNLVLYRFKVDYDYTQFGGKGQASKMSTEYGLAVKE